MDSTSSGGLREIRHLQRVEGLMQKHGNFADLTETGSFDRIKIKMEAIRPINIIAPRIPLIQVGKSITLPDECSMEQI